MIRAHRRHIIHQLLTGPTLDSEMSGDDISHSLSLELQIFESAGEAQKQKGKGSRQVQRGWECP